MKKEKVLVIDDEADMLSTCKKFLTRAGYEVSVAGQGAEALGMLDAEVHDLVITDLKMPGMDGMEVLREVKGRHPETVVMMFTGYGTIQDAVLAMKEGAFDFITKPFSPRELVARTRAVLRRAGGETRQRDIIRVGDLEIDLGRHLVSRAGESVHLTPIEFNILTTLAQQPGQTFSRSQLLDRLHGVTYESYDRSVDSHVKNLRHKLEPDPSEPVYVLTVYGVGYRFNDEV